MGSAAKKRPRTKPPEERREELMNAAQKLFLEHGVGPTTVEQITTGADVAKGTFYLYFPTKEDVLAAMQERFGRTLLEKIRAGVAEKQDSDWKGKLAAWGVACVNGYLDSIELHDILFFGTRMPRKRGAAVDHIVVDDLVELVKGGAEAGAWNVEDSRFAAVFLFSGLHGVVDDASAKEQRIDRGRLGRRAEQICLRAVGL
jgi:AcrR family transcriptional regulator